MHEKICFRIKKVLRLYVIWSIIYLPLTFCGWIIEGNRESVYLLRCVRNFILVGENFYSWALWYLNGLVFALIFIDLLLRVHEEQDGQQPAVCDKDRGNAQLHR